MYELIKRKQVVAVKSNQRSSPTENLQKFVIAESCKKILEDILPNPNNISGNRL